MKNIIIFLLALTIGCNATKQAKQPTDVLVTNKDTLVVYKPIEKKIVDSNVIKKADSLAILLGKANNQLAAYKHQTDSLKTQLFLANYRVEQVKVYIKICNRKPSQIKFLKGWITRAVQ